MSELYPNPCPGCGGMGTHDKRPCSYFDGPCEHGRQRRKCEVCELIATDSRIALLEAAVKAADELYEHTRRLLGHAKPSGDFYLIHCDGMLDLDGLGRVYDAARKKIGEE